ncbi:hypothetical protein BD410DRAFT_780502 [Rickenella mellea]|uniref:Uncharacterized protein n=1 Tax=Rickenella mellea TaxID=50990 RepID=A0A4R5XFQ1_9AGAM|nr:hypothetical protein BD410DRAFT_780502 [Rickenella mellea]
MEISAPWDDELITHHPEHSVNANNAMAISPPKTSAQPRMQVVTPPVSLKSHLSPFAFFPFHYLEQRHVSSSFAGPHAVDAVDCCRYTVTRVVEQGLSAQKVPSSLR